VVENPVKLAQTIRTSLGEYLGAKHSFRLVISSLPDRIEKLSRELIVIFGSKPLYPSLLIEAAGQH
jgi:hypothetical protein